MSAQDPPPQNHSPTDSTLPRRSTTSPQPNGSAHGDLPERPASTPPNPAQGGQAPDEKAHHARLGPRPAVTDNLRDMFAEQKEKLADKKEQLKQKSKPPGGYDPTPLPDAPPGYTVKFTFHSAANLPIGDLHLKSSDPYLHATLTADVPRRHKEDPLLTHRTRTLRRTTEPVWEDEWVVANVPETGFTLKCRLYDEDFPDHDDRLGNVTIRVPRVDEHWEGLGPDAVFEVKKRAGSKKAYLVKAATSFVCRAGSMTPRLHISAEVLGKSDPPHAQMYTVGPTTFVKHYSPMIGRLAGVKVNKDEEADTAASTTSQRKKDDRRTKKYDFQANEIQLSGPVPPRLYHRYVEFRPMIGRMFLSRGLRGHILHKILHKQHNRIYNFDASTEYGTFDPCSEDAALQFLRMAHFDEGGRIFTYVITLDGMMRFTETGKEFGIDLLSKHTMHSDVAMYVACAGEFFIRRLERPVRRHQHDDKDSRHDSHHDSHDDNHHDDNHHDDSTHNDSHHDSKEDGASASSSTTPNSHPNPNPNPNNASNPPPDPKAPPSSHPSNNDDLTHKPPTHPPAHPPGGPPTSPPPPNPRLYQLVIDNDSGTYRPDKSVLPDLQSFLSRNLPGLDVVTMHCADKRLDEMKRAQMEVKKREGAGVKMVGQLGRGPPSGDGVSMVSSDDESRLGEMEALEAREREDIREEDERARRERERKEGRSKRERVFDVVSEPGRWREAVGLEGKGK